jgi:hypothetical protein
MLIPLGILAASGAGVDSDYELIATTFGTGSSGTITFSSIPQTYKHLQIRSVQKSTASNNRLVRMRFNGVSSASYSTHFIQGSGSSIGSFNITSGTFVELFYSAFASAANSFGAGIVDVLDYSSTTKNTTVRVLSGQTQPDADNVRFTSGLFINTAAVTSVSFEAAADSFNSLTRFSLYGIKG